MTSREDEIIQAAVELFASRGYEKTSMADIAASLGITKGSLYYYVPSKRNLLAKTLLGFHIVLSSGPSKIIKSQESSPEKLRKTIRHHVEFFFKYYPTTCVFLDERLTALSSRQRGKVIQERDRYENIWRKIITEGIEQGYFRNDLDVAMMVRGILGMCNWMIKWYKPDGKWSPHRVADIFSEIILHGIQTSPFQNGQVCQNRKTKKNSLRYQTVRPITLDSGKDK